MTIGLKAFPCCPLWASQPIGVARMRVPRAGRLSRRNSIRQSAVVGRRALRRQSRAGTGPVRSREQLDRVGKTNDRNPYAQELALLGMRAARVPFASAHRVLILLPFVFTPFQLDLANQVLLAIGALLLLLLMGFAADRRDCSLAACCSTVGASTRETGVRPG